MKIIVIVLLVFLALYISFVLMLYLKQNSYVFFPPRQKIDLQPIANFIHQEVRTRDGLVIKGYYLAPSKSKPVIIEFHGNASHPAWEAGKFQNLINDGYGFFLAEYRGYDQNPGISSEVNFYEDGAAYINWVKNNPDLKGHPVVVYGSSIGSGVAVDVAKNNPDIAALILEVPFDKLSAVGAYHYPYIPFGEVLMKNKFPNGEKIKNIKAPTLFLLARQDRVVPIQFGQALADLANEPKAVHVFEEAGHVNIFDYGAEKVIQDFLRENIHE